MSALDDYPRELSLTKRRGRWLLVIHAPDLKGEVESTGRDVIDAVLDAYAAMRQEARRP